MIILSAYLLSSSLIALVAVTAPGMYPMRALHAASDLMMGRRVRFILRLIALVLALAIIWVIVMIPLIFFDLLMRGFEDAEHSVYPGLFAFDDMFYWYLYFCLPIFILPMDATL